MQDKTRSNEVKTIRQWISYWRHEENSSVGERLKALYDSLDLMEIMTTIIEEASRFKLDKSDDNFLMSKITHLEESFKEITMLSGLDEKAD